ncbi:MAG: hypothetical protein M3R45_10050 [Pseudomonadota bacterium]|nr:hypothetical protein [Pseudomonadota bacterium]
MSRSCKRDAFGSIKNGVVLFIMNVVFSQVDVLRSQDAAELTAAQWTASLAQALTLAASRGTRQLVRLPSFALVQRCRCIAGFSSP